MEERDRLADMLCDLDEAMFNLKEAVNALRRCGDSDSVQPSVSSLCLIAAAPPSSPGKTAVTRRSSSVILARPPVGWIFHAAKCFKKNRGNGPIGQLSGRLIRVVKKPGLRVIQQPCVSFCPVMLRKMMLFR